MRLFNANRASPSEADRARDLRLTSIASRYRARPEISLVPDSEPEAHPEPVPDAPQEELPLEPEVSQEELLLQPEQPERPEQPEQGEWPVNG